MGYHIGDIIAKLGELEEQFAIALCAKSVPNALRYSLGEEIISGLSDLDGKLNVMRLKAGTNFNCTKRRQELRYPSFDMNEEADEAHREFTALQAKIRLYCKDRRVKIGGVVLGLSGELGKMLFGWCNTLNQPRSEV